MLTTIYSPSRRSTETFSTTSTRTFTPGARRSTRTTFAGTDFEAKPASRTFADDPFRARFGHRLPRGLREEARGMEWSMFNQKFCAAGGPLSLQSFTIDHMRAGRATYTITIADQNRPAGHRAETVEIVSTGAISAMTHVLADSGRRIEIEEFHQYSIFEATATIIYATHNNRRIWVVGFGPTPEISSANALVNAANRLF